MKKLTLLLAVALGFTVFYSCSSEDDVQTPKKAEFQFKVNISDLTKANGDTSDVPEACTDPDAVNNETHYLYVHGSINGIALDFYDAEFIKDPVTGTIISSRQYFELPEGSTESNIVVKIDNASIFLTKGGIDLSPDTPNDDPVDILEYSTVSASEQGWDGIVPDNKRTEALEFTLQAFTKTYIDLLLVCGKQYPLNDFGFYWIESDLYKKTCFPVFADICGDPCNINASMKDQVANAHIQMFRIEKNANKCWWKANPGFNVSTDVSEQNVGSICFIDKGSVPDNEEAYMTIISMGKDNSNASLVFGGILTVEDLTFIENNLFQATENSTKYLHLELCPTTWENWVNGSPELILASNGEKTVKLDLLNKQICQCYCYCHYDINLFGSNPKDGLNIDNLAQYLEQTPNMEN